MATLEIIQPVAPGRSSVDHFAAMLLAITSRSGHSFEHAVYRLLLDIIEHRDEQVLYDSEYCIIIGKAADVADYFNYDVELLGTEPNTWYRASIIHQMGQGMLQAIERMRPDLTHSDMFNDAMAGLCLGKSAAICKRWANDIEPAPKLRLVISDR